MSFQSSNESIGKNIFISHIHEEQKIALALQEILQEEINGIPKLFGTKCFRSSDKTIWVGGEPVIERIKEELGLAKVVVLMFSPKSILRPWLHIEAGAAWIT